VARKRMIDPRIWESEQVQDLTAVQFKVYIYLISSADDEGRFKAIPRIIAAQAMLLDPGYTDASDDMAAIEASGLIKLYEVDGQKYGYHPNWGRYQSIQKKVDSVLPAPPSATDHVREGYSTPTVGVSPNRIEENRIEENIITATAGVEDAQEPDVLEYEPGELVPYDVFGLRLAIEKIEAQL
jgi:hypothetical protein